MIKAKLAFNYTEWFKANTKYEINQSKCLDKNIFLFMLNGNTSLT